MNEKSITTIITAMEKYLPIIFSMSGKKLNKQIEYANMLFKAKKYDDALAEYRKIAQKNPKNLRPKLGVVSVHRKNGDSLEALVACGMALEVSVGDKTREARVYNTMGAVAEEFFKIYYRKKDIDKAIFYFDKAANRSKDIYIKGNIIDCCVSALTNIKNLSDNEENYYKNRVYSELEMIKDLLDTNTCAYYALSDTKEVIGYLENVIEEYEYKWLNEGMNSLKKSVANHKIDNITKQGDKGRSLNRRISKKITKAFASLVIISFISGFQIIDSPSNNKNNGDNNMQPVNTEIQQNNISNAKKIWKDVGMLLFTVDTEKNEQLIVNEEIHDWKRVQIKEVDIDRMTS